MKKYPRFAIFIVLAIILVSPFSVLAETKAGTKSGSFFYFFDKAFENTSLFFTFNPEKKAKKALENAEERLAEAEELASENKPEAVKTAMENYKKNIEALEKVLIKVPEEAKEAIEKAIEASKERQEEAMKETTELEKEDLETKPEVEETENELKEEENDKESEIKDDKKDDQSKEIEKLKKEVEALKQKTSQIKVIEKIEKIIEKPIVVENKQSSSSQTKQKDVTLPSGAVVEMDEKGNVVKTIKEVLQQAYVTPESMAQSQTSTTVQISSINITPTITSAKIEWQTDKPTESKIFLSGGGFSSKIYNSESGLSTRHSVSVGGLKGDTNYSYEIEAIASGSAYKKTGGFLTQSPPPPTFSITKTPVSGPSWSGWNTFNINSANGAFVFEAITIEMTDPDVAVDPQTREGYVQSMTLIKSGWNYRHCDAINNAFLEWQSKSYPYPCPTSSTNPIYLTMSNPTWQNTKIGLTFHPGVLFPPGTEIYYYKVVEQGTGKVFEYQK